MHALELIAVRLKLLDVRQVALLAHADVIRVHCFDFLYLLLIDRFGYFLLILLAALGLRFGLCLLSIML